MQESQQRAVIISNNVQYLDIPLNDSWGFDFAFVVAHTSTSTTHMLTRPEKNHEMRHSVDSCLCQFVGNMTGI